LETEILQPWKTIGGGNTTVTTVVQEEEGWLELSGACDATFWVDVRSVNPGRTGTITLTLQSSPTRDELLFQPINVPVTLSASATPFVVRTIPGAASVSPLARWVRWSLASVGGAAGQWNATLRIRVSRSRTPYFSPTMVPGCAVWMRSDLGVTLVSASSVITSWADQTGNTANTLTASGSPTYSATGFGSPIAAPAIQTFKAATDGFLKTTGATISQGDSMIVVAQTVGTPLAAQQIFISGPTGSVQALGQAASTTTTLNIDASAGTPKTVPVAALTTASIIQVDFNNTNTLAYQNGSILNGGSPVAPGTEALQFGSVGNGPSGLFPVNANFAEILLFQPILTPAWRTVVTRYLGARYGITVP
jgi:hypothetical protein